MEGTSSRWIYINWRYRNYSEAKVGHGIDDVYIVTQGLKGVIPMIRKATLL